MLDAAEFVGPGSDIALGLYRLAPFYYGPGFNKPNGTGECIVSLKAWNALDAELKAIVSHACAAEASFALAEMERLNIEALAALTSQHNVKLGVSRRISSPPPARKPRMCSRNSRAATSARGACMTPMMAFRERAGAWSRISLQAIFEARIVDTKFLNSTNFVYARNDPPQNDFIASWANAFRCLARHPSAVSSVVLCLLV